MRSPTCTLRRLLPALLAVALLAPPLAHGQETGAIPAVPSPEIDAPAAPNAVVRRQQAVRDRILAGLGQAAIAADLYELEELLGQGGSLERGADTLRQVIRSPKVGPEVRALAHRLLADVERLRGSLPRMEESLEAIGAIRQVALIGPFDDENEGGYDAVYGPEEDLDLARTHPGLRGEVRWRVVEDLGTTGTLMLHEAIRPAQEVVAYVLAELEAPRATGAKLYLGTPGGTRGWLNGEPIVADPDYHPARFDQRSVRVRLQKGRNLLLLKVGAGDAGPFRLHARVVGLDGRPIPGLQIRAPEQGSFPAPKAIAAGQVIRGDRPIVDVLAKEAEGGDPASLYAYARLLAERHPFDESEKLHEAAAELAAKAAPRDVDAQLLAARTADDVNERLAFLEQAAAVEPTDEARAHAALANFWLRRGDGFRALRLLRDRAAGAAGDWPAMLVLARALDSQGFEARALQLTEQLAERYRDEPRLLSALARHRLRDRRGDEAARLYRVSLGLRPASLDAASALASILVDRGQVEEADQVLQSAARLQPVDLELLLRRADLLAVNGGEEEARALYAQAAALAPQEGEVYERAGQSALRSGATDEAMAFFQRSLQVRPQNARLKEQLQALQPGATSFAAPWLHDLREAAERAKAHEGEDAAKLVDLVATRVLPSGQSSRTVQTIVRVQSQRGLDRYRATPIRYAPDREQITVERARILKADGTIVDSHTEQERGLNEAWSGMYFDTRTRMVGFPSLQVGDVVELVYTVDDVARDNLLGDYFGDVNFVQDTVPTEHWEYVLQMPAGREIFASGPAEARYEEKAGEAGATLHRWTATDVEKVIPEPGMPGWSEVASYLHVSTYRDWESVARFWWGLVKDQVRPTPMIRRLAEEIVADIPEEETESRVRAVYDYVVKNTRYVGLEFGIHSFKPYKVEQVLRRGFGDCKDKASLAYALLESIGIDSNLVLLRMRHLGEIGEAPASLAVFNHAILYVPGLDLWLDGTAEWSGSRELPESDRGAEVLVVDPDGSSHFGQIPEAPASLSGNETEQRIALTEDGAALVEGETTISGIPAPRYRRAYASPNGRKASFEQAWARDFPGASVAELEMNDLTSLEEDVQVRFGLQIPRYAEKRAGGRLSFRPLGNDRSWRERFAAVSSRQHPLVLRHAFENRFRYEYTLPEGYEVERLPRAGRVESPFGRAELALERQGETIVVRASVALEKPRIEPSDYAAFRSFLGQVDDLFTAQVIVSPAAAGQGS